MKVSVIGTVGLPAKYGGFETLTENLVDHLNNKFEFTVYCSSKNRIDRPQIYKNAKLVYIGLNANGIQSIPYDIISIFKAVFKSDVLLILGVSGCISLPIVRLFSKKKLVINIDGLEWKRQKWGALAKAFLKLSEKLAVKYADEVISDNKAIQDYVKLEYGKPSNLIAYGADHVVPGDNLTKLDWSLEYPRNGYAIKVCRIEPENNIDKVLEAFSRCDSLPLVVIGNWENSAYGTNLKDKYRNEPNIKLLDPIYDINKLHLLRSNAAVYIHGHSAGGTNPSLVEAMYLKLPIVAFDVNYNRETTHNKAIYFSDAEDLITQLESLDKDRLSVVASSMRSIAENHYVWSKIADLYASLLVND